VSGSSRIETLANIAILLAALVVAALGVHRLLAPPARGAGPAQEVKAGASVAVPGVDWRSHRRSLVLALSPGCHFCTESAPFYRRLAREALAAGSVHLVCLFSDHVKGGPRYLRDLELPFDDVRSASFETLGVAGTPTLLLVDGNGIVSRVWVGKLSPAGEADVLRQIEERS
jgi:hypothetical protein